MQTPCLKSNIFWNQFHCFKPTFGNKCWAHTNSKPCPTTWAPFDGRVSTSGSTRPPKSIHVALRCGTCCWSLGRPARPWIRYLGEKTWRRNSLLNPFLVPFLVAEIPMAHQKIRINRWVNRKQFKKRPIRFGDIRWHPQHCQSMPPLFRN